MIDRFAAITSSSQSINNLKWYSYICFTFLERLIIPAII